MIYSIEVSKQAEADLRGIYLYIAYELQSPENASGQLDRLEKSMESLARMPERFREYDKESYSGRGLRIMPVDNYCVFYVPNKVKKAVEIVRVIYSGQDVDAQLNEYVEK